MANSTLQKFTNLYQLSKTLRLELKPQGKTLENIVNNRLLEKDEKRADGYKILKKVIDEFHKYFINESLSNIKLSGLNDFVALYQVQKRDDIQKKEFEEIHKKLRKQIVEKFKNHELFSKLDKSELFKISKEKDLKYKGLLSKWIFNNENIKNRILEITELNNEEELLNVLSDFESFSTYFTGFHENRKNMYSDEDKSTAIAFRVIHQNLPKFIDNQRVFSKIVESPLKEQLPVLLKELEPIIQVNSIEEMFDVEFFSETANQLGIDQYNHLLGGFVADDDKVKIKGLNEYINLYNQKVKDKKDRLGKLKPLFKQILSDRNTASFLPEEFNDDAHLLESVEKLFQELNEEVFSMDNNLMTLPKLLKSLGEFDLNKIYLKNDLGLTDISQKVFGSWGVIQDAIKADFKRIYIGKHQPETEQFEAEQKKFMNKNDSYSIAYLNACILLLENKEYHKKIENYFSFLGNYNDQEQLNYFENIKEKYLAVEDVLKTYPENKDLAQDKNNVEKIKDLLDAIKNLQHFVKPLLGKGDEALKEDKFYGDFTQLWQTLDQITPLYNMVRNYVTKKPYSTEKIKLNFENSTLLDGWDANKEEANTSILFEKNGNYFLGIMDKNHNKIFRKIPKSISDNSYLKVNYKLLPGASKMLPKVFFSQKNISYYQPNDEILRIRNHGSHTKNGKPQEGYEKIAFDLKDCRAIIDFFKDSIFKHPEWKAFGFNFSNTNSYNSIDEFYREVEAQGYGITYTKIDNEYINQLVDEGKLYLFQIYNKDFSPYTKGTPNMHTMYWKMLFDEKNLKDVVYKLNGQAEIFYRKSSIKKEDRIIHKAHESIENKNEFNKKKESLFSYDIIKDKRYTVDKFQFHVPITLNFKASGSNNVNTIVNETIKENGIQHIIGIDRGERHLLYLSVIDMDGNIKEQYSLNEMVNEYNGNTYKTNYKSLLETKEGGRDDARKNWKTIETIKELKEGYLSQVIHKIAQLVVKYNAIVVLEDLNMGFMRGRQKVEKQVYQKFEKMLIDKFNYLVDKKKQPTELGGVLNALQLTNKFESFQKLGKQSGFLFYIPAWNTSKMDPVTGFVNLFYTKYENVEKSKAFFEKFKAIGFNKKENYFEFVVDNYTLFNAKAEDTKQNWTICTNAGRIETFRNKEKNSNWDNRTVVLTDEFIKLFNEFKINYSTIELRGAILSQNDKAFFERFMYLFKLTLQMRNSITNSEVDYLISPVANKNNEFYDSRNLKENLPKDADANGAFNIARKGLWALEQIKKAPDLKKIKLAISNKEWLNFVQTKN